MKANTEMAKNRILTIDNKNFPLSKYNYKRISKYLGLVEIYLEHYQNKKIILRKLEKRIARVLIANGSKYENDTKN